MLVGSKFLTAFCCFVELLELFLVRFELFLVRFEPFLEVFELSVVRFEPSIRARLVYPVLRTQGRCV